MATASVTPLSHIFSTFSTSKFSSFHSISITPTKSSGDQKLIVHRREFLKGIILVPILWKEPPISEAREVEVGSYLPSSPSDSSFVVFKATSKDTPALRAGMALLVALENFTGSPFPTWYNNIFDVILDLF